MNLSKINAIAFKAVGVIIAAALLILKCSIAMHHLFIKAGIVLVSAAIAGMLRGNKPTFISWLLLLGILLTTVYIVEILNKL